MVLEIGRENNMKPPTKTRSVAAQKALALFVLCIALAARGIHLGQCAEREESAFANSSESIDGVALFLK